MTSCLLPVAPLGARRAEKVTFSCRRCKPTYGDRTKSVLAWERWRGQGFPRGTGTLWGQAGVLLILLAGTVSQTCARTKLSRSCTVNCTSASPFAFLSQLLHQLVVWMWLCMLACFFF